jgi:biopolymer transport protein ExbD
MSQHDYESPDAPFVGENIELVHHRSSRKREVKAADMSLNLTAMIDVIFLLLIYFVVTSSFAVGEGVIVARMPEGTGTETPTLAPPKQKLVVRVSSVGDEGYVLTVQGYPTRPATFVELYAILQQMQGTQHKDDDPVVIQPDRSVRWQHALNAFNQAVKARYKDVRFGQSTP